MRSGRSWTYWRNRLFASAGFQRWASRTPGFRSIARTHARGLFDLTAGFVYSQIAAAFIESGLFAKLQERSLTLAEAAAAARLPEPAALTLLRAAESLELAESAGAAWTLGARGAMLAGTPGVPEMIAHHRTLYADLADPLAMLRGEGAGRLASLWSYDGAADPEAVAAYSALMAASQPMVAAQALAAYRFDRHRRMLDIGGGTGAFVAAVAEAAPALGLGLFDLPAVAARAKCRLGERVEIHSGNFRSDPLPTGYDLITLVRVLHDHDDAVAAPLLRAIAAALPPRGRLLIVEPLAGTSGAARVGGYFEFYLAAMRSGRPRTAGELRTMLAAAGFAKVRVLRTPLPMVASAVLAERGAV
jgi:demethylspheroidene O-methyltransferase